MCRIKSVCRNKNDNPSFIFSWVIHKTLKKHLSKDDKFNFIVSLFYRIPFKGYGPDWLQSNHGHRRPVLDTWSVCKSNNNSWPTRDSPTFQYLSVVSTRLVNTKQSPHFKAFYKQYPVKITLDTGAEISMIKFSVAQRIGTVIKKSNQSALHVEVSHPWL